GVAFQAAERNRRRPTSGAERDRLGYTGGVQAAVVRSVGSGCNADGQCGGHVLAPLWTARPRRRHARGSRIRTAVCTRTTPSAVARFVPNLVLLHHSWPARGCRGGRGRRRLALGGPRR